MFYDSDERVRISTLSVWFKVGFCLWERSGLFNKIKRGKIKIHFPGNIYDGTSKVCVQRIVMEVHGTI